MVRTPAFQADNRGSIPRRATMLILSIETSCDDTACAIVKIAGKTSPKFEILSSIISSQIKVHAPFGGVVPTLAAREHAKNLPIVFKKALRAAKVKMEDIDYIAVTQGPGLVIALLVGAQFARGLAYAFNKKIIPVNHISGHIFSNWLANEKTRPVRNRISNGIKFPVLNIIVSGGHTELILMKKIGSYEILGSTRDDAAGEAFDKFAKMLGLGYPGGPAIARLAEQWNDKFPNSKFQTNLKIPNSKFPLPRPMINSKDYDFSFSGLKTAVLYMLRNKPEIKKNKKLLIEFCAEFQQAVVDVIVAKTIKAAREYKVKTVALAGGVSANKKLRLQLETAVKQELKNVDFLVPPMKFTTDNAAMIAAAAYFNRKKATSWENLDADANLTLR